MSFWWLVLTCIWVGYCGYRVGRGAMATDVLQRMVEGLEGLEDMPLEQLDGYLRAQRELDTVLRPPESALARTTSKISAMANRVTVVRKQP